MAASSFPGSTGIRQGLAALSAVALTVGLWSVVPGVPSQAEPLSDCWDSDNGDPLLTSVSLSPAEVDVTSARQTVTITAAAEDTGGPGPATGMRRLDAYVVDRWGEYHRVGMTAGAPGEWSGALTIPRWAAPGAWRIDSVELVDRTGQQVSYGGENSRDLAAVPGVHRVRVTSAVTDSTAPVLTGFSMRPDSVDTRNGSHYVRFTARARDDETGVAQVAVTLFAPHEEDGAGVVLHKVRGTAHTYRGRVLMRRWIPDGTWQVWAVWLVNRTGRTKIVRNGALGRLGFERDLRVVSGHESTPPGLVALRRGPAAVDVRVTAARVTLTVRARDARSGVRSVYAGFGGRVRADTRMRLVSGTRRDGVWRGTATFDPCPSVSGDWPVWVGLEDRAGNLSNYSATRLRKLGMPAGVQVTARPDALPPTVRGMGYQVPLDGPFRLTFPQAVNGITAESATVRQYHFDSDEPPGPVLSGRWRCRTAASALTSCSTGRVRIARFWPDAPLHPGGYAVEVNPEHSLEVTDLAGNPFDRDGVAFEAVRK